MFMNSNLHKNVPFVPNTDTVCENVHSPPTFLTTFSFSGALSKSASKASLSTIPEETKTLVRIYLTTVIIYRKI